MTFSIANETVATPSASSVGGSVGGAIVVQSQLHELAAPGRPLHDPSLSAFLHAHFGVKLLSLPSRGEFMGRAASNGELI